MSLNRFAIFFFTLFAASFFLSNNFCLAQLTIPQKEFTICKGDVASIDVTIDGPLPVFIVLKHIQSTIKYTYTSESTNSFEINLINEGTYTIFQYGTNNDTTDVVSEAIMISFFPPVSISLEGDGTFCTTYNIDPVRISFTGTSPYMLEYINNGVSDTLITDDSTYSFDGYEERTIQTIRVTDANCHIDTSAQLVHELVSVPEPQISGDNMVCDKGLGEYSADLSSFKYSWLIPNEAVYISPSNKNSKDITLRWNSPGNYLIRMQILNDVENCASNWVNYDVIVVENPVADINIDTIVCFDLIDNLDITIPVSTNEKIYWPGQNLTSSSATFSESGNYSYWLTNENECADTGFVTIGDSCSPALFVPEAFTPNNDQINDLLELFGLYYNLEFSIYSESGQLLFTMYEEDDFWDGKSDGKDLPNGTYFWYAKFTSRTGKQYTMNGHVNLIR